MSWKRKKLEKAQIASERMSRCYLVELTLAKLDQEGTHTKQDLIHRNILIIDNKIKLLQMPHFHLLKPTESSFNQHQNHLL